MTQENKPAEEQEDLFQSLGKILGSIPAEEVTKRVVAEATAYNRRQAEALEDIRNELSHLVKLLKPWAEREKRKNIIEQDPDYLAAVVKQVQQQRNKSSKKTKVKKRK